MHTAVRESRVHAEQAGYSATVTVPEEAMPPAPEPRTVRWDGAQPAMQAIRRALAPLCPPGGLRLCYQLIDLHEQGKPAGSHEVIDVVLDVEGNLVAMSLREAVRRDAQISARLDSALASLRAELDAQGLVGRDALEVVLDADESSEVGILFGLEMGPQDVSGPDRHPAIHDGDHHIIHNAPELEELRDRFSQPEPEPLRRLLSAIREQFSAARERFSAARER